MRIKLHIQWGETFIESEDITDIKANTDSYGKSIVFYQSNKGKIREQVVKETPDQIRQLMKK
jgi:hypothetical protein